MPDVSVLIPTYNRLWSLPRAVDSCRHTRCDVEIVVMDDGSTDGTWDWLQSQTGIVALRQEHQGKPAAVNQAFAASHGRYLRILDSDDFLAPGTIDLQFDTAVATGAGVVYGRVDRYDEKTATPTMAPEVSPWDDFVAVMLGEGYGSHFLGMQFTRALVENAPHRPEFAHRDDRMFLLEVALQKPVVAPTPGCAGYWVTHDRQMHTSYAGPQVEEAARQHLALYRTILNRLSAAGELTPRRARAAAGVLWPVLHTLARTDLAEAARLDRWLRTELCPDFTLPESRPVRALYRLLGFSLTQRLFRLRRTVLGRDATGR